jgi:hypothetical protein
MEEDKDSWGGYSKLVLKELERLNDNHERMRLDMDNRFAELNFKISGMKHIEKDVATNSSWINKVNEVWSPMQMLKAKEEIEKQQNRWAAAVAVLSFIQLLMGMAIVIWGKFK